VTRRNLEFPSGCGLGLPGTAGRHRYRIRDLAAGRSGGGQERARTQVYARARPEDVPVVTEQILRLVSELTEGGRLASSDSRHFGAPPFQPNAKASALES
jgi:hypothetical protein